LKQRPNPLSVIASLSNPKIKETAALRGGKHRRRSGKFLIDGFREFDRAVQAGIRIIEVFTVQQQFERQYPAQNFAVQPVTEAVLKKIAFGDRNEGFVAVAEEPERTFEMFETQIGKIADPLLAVVERAEKPGNLGAVFRSADGAGLDGVMIADTQTDPFHANSIRSSMATVFRLPMVSGDSVRIKRWLQDRNIQIAAAQCSGEAVPYTGINFCKPTAIILGNEHDGLSGVWNGNGIVNMTLPMRGMADSLNVSVAAGILFYEAGRQREKQKGYSHEK
jgi:TrmH family RNA methyltransferase